MSKNINDLREVMFETLTALRSGAITVEQARAMSDVGRVLIDTAKVEVEHMRVSGGGVSGFIEPEKPVEGGVLSIVRHRIAG